MNKKNSQKPLPKPVKKSSPKKSQKLKKMKPKKKKGNTNSAEKHLNDGEFVSIKDFVVVKTESENVKMTVSVTVSTQPPVIHTTEEVSKGTVIALEKL